MSIAKRTTNRSALITANTVESPNPLTLPPMDSIGRLPVGQYHMNWEEFVSNFVNTERRHHLSEGMLAALNDLRKAGAKEVEVGGSFVSRKPDPSDFDLVWNAQGVRRSRLPREIGYNSHSLYGGHIFEAETPIYGLKGITTSTQLIRTARSGERFGTAVIDLTRDLPKARRLFETLTY